MSDLPSVASLRVEKPGKSKFAPVLASERRKQPAATTASPLSQPPVGTGDAASEQHDRPPAEQHDHPSADQHDDASLSSAKASNVQPVVSLPPAPPSSAEPEVPPAPNTRSKRRLPEDSSSSHERQADGGAEADGGAVATPASRVIESVRLRRDQQRQSGSAAQQQSLADTAASFALPSLPKPPGSAASLPDLAESAASKPKLTMFHFLRDQGAGLPMKALPQEPPSEAKGKDKGGAPSVPVVPRTGRSVSAVIAPQVRVVDGNIVVDEENSAVTSAATPEDFTSGMDIVHETNRRFTSATYAKHSGTNRWKAAETNFFYQALSMCGTDFSMIATFFPHRTRAQIKGKYKLEERNDPERVARHLASQTLYDPSLLDQVVKSQQSSKSSRDDGRAPPSPTSSPMTRPARKAGQQASLSDDEVEDYMQYLEEGEDGAEHNGRPEEDALLPTGLRRSRRLH